MRTRHFAFEINWPLVEPNFQQNSIVDQQHFFIFHIALALEKSWHDLYHSSIVHNVVKAFWSHNLVKVNWKLRNLYFLTNFNHTNIFHTPGNIGNIFLEEKSKQLSLPEKLKSHTVKIYRKLKHTIGMITYRNTVL